MACRDRATQSGLDRKGLLMVGPSQKAQNLEGACNPQQIHCKQTQSGKTK